MTGRAWFRVHSWLGVMAGLLMFVICWSGTVATLAHEIDWLLNPALRVVPQAQRASWAEIHAAVQAAVPDGTISRLHAPRGSHWAAEALVNTPADQLLRVYVNPHTAEVQGITSFFNVQRFFRSFHMTLFLPYPVGTYVVGTFGLLLLSSMTAALFFYKRWWQRFLQVRWGNGLRALWSELHKAVGLWSLWFVLLIGITGAWYLIEQLGTDLVDPDFAYPPDPTFVSRSAPLMPLDDLVARARELRPDLTIASVGFPSDEATALLYFDGQAGHVLVRNRANKLYLDAHNGQLVATQSASDLNAFERWIDTADPLHFGDFGGLLTKVIWFFFGLLLSGLCLTGAYLHAQRLKRESGPASRARWAGARAALAASVAVLLAATYYGSVEARGYGPIMDGIRLAPEVPTAVTLFLAAWVAITIALLAWWGWLLRERATSASAQ